mgnify:CR=1 FL=1
MSVAPLTVGVELGGYPPLLMVFIRLGVRLVGSGLPVFIGLSLGICICYELGFYVVFLWGISWRKPCLQLRLAR